MTEEPRIPPGPGLSPLPGAPPSPMMRQYRELKQRYPDHLLLFRLGDFYELFAEDAREGARLLSITLTARQSIPMAGIPHHAADTYIARLIRAGRKVAVCEQMEAPGRGKKLVRREVVRVVTPGTVTDTQYLDGAANNFLLAAHRGPGSLGVALVDVSTGEFLVGEEEGAGERLLEAALLRRPAEVVLGASADPTLAARMSAVGIPVTRVDAAWFGARAAREALAAQFSAAPLEAWGVGAMSSGIQAAGGALAYLRETQGDALGHLAVLGRLDTGEAMLLDETAVATLELFETAQDRRRGSSLFATVDQTCTPMGARLLRQWLLRPLLDPAVIGQRQDAVAELVGAPSLRATLRRRLQAIGDVERLASRAALGVAHARDLVALRTFLRGLSGLADDLGAVAAGLLVAAREDTAVDAELARVLDEALTDEPPPTLREGGLIRESWSPELRELRHGIADAKEWIASLETRERERTGIGSLRVRFNRVFGYGIEVSNAHTARVPPEYVRRQTLVGAERYITTELKEQESRVLGAEERIARLELELFGQVRAQVGGHAQSLLRTARALALLDAVCSLAETAHTRGHVRPVVDASLVIDIADGRHPVIETLGDAPFTPNDVSLDPSSSQVVILTGPNMSGKSVFMRQTALLVILAQTGAFVPARTARVGVVDRVLTRVGAQDNQARGQSTFLVEMVETASILRNATARSLVLLDEVGRGTSTFDGLAIAWAVTEELHERGRGAKVLFATHYHELTALADGLPRVRNFHVAVREWNDEIVFLHKVRPGGTDRSYGIQVARLAGLPPAVIHRAREILADLASERRGMPGAPPASAEDPVQLGLFPPAHDPILKDLAALEISGMTPLEALNLLAEWQRQVRARA